MFGVKTEKQLEDGSEDCEHLLPASERSSLDSQLSRPASRGPSWLTAAITIVWTAIISAAFGAWVAQMGRIDADAFSVRHISQYSPIVKDVGITYNTIRFNGSLLKANAFRLDAGPEVDAAWKSLGADYHAARIPVEEAEKSGLAPDQVKVKEKYGGGYPAHVEGLHHSESLWLGTSSTIKTKVLAPSQMMQISVSVAHCLDILRQQLMCTVDVGVLGQVWYQPPDKPVQAFVDFNTLHKCRNFDAIRDWAEKHQLPNAEDTPADFLEPPKDGDRVWHTVP